MKNFREQLIAIVDDESDIRELVSTNLQNSGYKTKTFADALSFYKYIGKIIPDLVILYLMLPDEDGIEICKNLKKNGKFAMIPIIILYANSDEFDKIIGLELGDAKGYIKNIRSVGYKVDW